MPATMCATCPMCDANLFPSEIRDGWCESCGKRLPLSVMAGSGPAKSSQSPYQQKREGTNKITFGFILVLFICMTISITAAVLAWGSGPFAMAVGGGVGGGLSVVIGRMLEMLPKPEAD